MTGSALALVPDRRWRIASLVGLGIVTIAIALSMRAIDWATATRTIATSNVSWLLVAVIANACIIASAAAVWTILAPPESNPRYWRMVEITSIAVAVMNSVPFLAGHATAGTLLVKRARVSPRGALSMLALDQLGEALVKVAIYLAALGFAPLPDWMHAGVVAASAGAVALFVGLVIASRARWRWAEHLAPLRSWSRAGAAFVAIAGTKVMQALAMLAVQHAFGLSLGAPATLLVLAAVLLATMVPASPGNLGTYEAAAFLAYRYLGVGAELALALAIVQHVCFMIPSVGVGYSVAAVRSVRG